jgi:hypothetical protein
MVIEIPTVHPGELIRAELVKDIADVLRDLDTRVSALEALPGGGPSPASGDVRVDTFEPPAPKIGDTMTIEGAHFDFTFGGARVTFAGTPITSFLAGSTDEKLIFEVPAIPSVPPAGRQLVMRVENFDTHVDRTVTIFPRPGLHEDVDVAYVATTPATPVAGQPAFVHLTLTSRGSFDATVTVTPSVSTGWSGLQVLTALSPPQVVADRQILLPALATKDVYIQIPIPGAVPQDTPFTLTVDAQGQGATGSLLKGFTVGQAAPVEDSHIKLEVQGIEGGTLIGSTISIASGGTAEFTLSALFDLSTSYTVTASFVGAASGWSLDAPTTFSFTINDADRNLPGGWAGRAVFAVINAGTSGSPPPQLKIAALRQGQTVGRERTFQLVRT